MNPDWLDPFINWIRMNPEWSYLLVFLTAALESLAIVGLIMPGVVIMFAIGALVAIGAMPLFDTIMYAALGAIAGDTFSFWLGRHYHQQLRVIWPFKRYPKLINHGVDFFTRHGGKSVLFARFVGPVRPILPAIAGMLDMPVGRFLAVDIIAALLWAPAYLLPGVVFGASLSLAAEVAGRLVIVIVTLVAAIWFIAWLIHRLFNLLQPRINAMVNALQQWSRQHPLSEPLLGALLDPDHPEARGLAQMVGLLFMTVLLFAALLNISMTGIDRWVYELFVDLHTPFATELMLSITELGSIRVLGPTFIALLLWLMLQRNWQAMWHALFAVISTVMLVYLLKNIIQSPRPIAFYNGLDQYGFPSSHTATATTFYGFMAVVIARELSDARRWLPYSIAALFISAIGLSRLYLGAHWLSDVVGGLILGLAVTALYGIAYRRHPAKRLPWRRTVLIGLVMIFSSAATNTPHEQKFLDSLDQVHPEVSVSDWWNGDWQKLPSHRIDLANRNDHPLNIQYAGELDTLSRVLQEKGWQQTPFPHWSDSLRWLVDIRDPWEYPLLPQVHDGRYETIRWIYRNGNEGLYVLRLWSAFGKASGIYIGNVSEVAPKESFYLFHFLTTTDNFAPAAQLLLNTLGGHLTIKAKAAHAPVQEVFLLRPDHPTSTR